MRILVTWGSKLGGTEGIARIVAEELQARGFEVVASSAERVTDLGNFDAVIVGGALYANRWPPNVQRFVNRHVKQLRRVPVWFFASGPLDDSADREELPIPTQVAALAERVGAKRCVTFGGRLEPDAKGFPASVMAKTTSGDWRNPDKIRAFADELADELPTATPGEHVDHPAHSEPHVIAHAVVGWGALTAIVLGLTSIAGPTVAVVLHAIAAPILFSAIAVLYFRVRGAREPLATAIAWTAVVALLDFIVVAGLLHRSLEMFTSFAGTWLPYALIFLASWWTGYVVSTLPWPTKKTDDASHLQTPDHKPSRA